MDIKSSDTLFNLMLSRFLKSLKASWDFIFVSLSIRALWD